MSDRVTPHSIKTCWFLVDGELDEIELRDNLITLAWELAGQLGAKGWIKRAPTGGWDVYLAQMPIRKGSIEPIRHFDTESMDAPFMFLVMRTAH